MSLCVLIDINVCLFCICSVVLDVAAEVFDTANELSDLGLTEQSLPLYENVSIKHTHTAYLLNIISRRRKLLISLLIDLSAVPGDEAARPDEHG